MKIRDILADKGMGAVTIREQATLHEALKTLIENNMGALPVTDGTGEVMGMISERDISREVYGGTHLDKKQVAQAMTRQVMTGAQEDNIEQVMERMTEGRFRHLPVIDGRNLVGIVSIGDVVRAQLRQARIEIGILMEHISGPVFD